MTNPYQNKPLEADESGIATFFKKNKQSLIVLIFSRRL